MSENRESIEEIMDSCLKSRNIQKGYEYVANGGQSNDIVNNMLEIWSLEKAHENKTVLWNVFSYDDLLTKWQVLDRILQLILRKNDLIPELRQYAEAEISVWVALVWILTKYPEIHSQTINLEILFCYWTEHHSKNIQILEAVYFENIKTLLSETIGKSEFYSAKKYMMKLKDADRESLLIQKIEEGIQIIEKKISERLYTPTCMEKIGQNYMIVDCWHDRVIYSDALTNIKEWNILDNQLWHPHSICEGRGILATENTEYGSICFYKWEQNNPIKLDEIFLGGGRPHRLLYDEKRDIFWILGGVSQRLYGIQYVNGHMKLLHKQKIQELHSSYVRSMRMIDDKFYLVSGPGSILELKFSDGKFVVEKKHKVPPKYIGMNDIIFFDGYFWISVYSSDKQILPALIKIRSLEDFGTGEYEDLYNSLEMKGIPYYFSWIDGKLCIPEIDTHSRIVLYDAFDGELKVNKVLYDFGKAEKEDILYMNRRDSGFTLI